MTLTLLIVENHAATGGGGNTIVSPVAYAAVCMECLSHIRNEVDIQEITKKSSKRYCLHKILTAVSSLVGVRPVVPGFTCPRVHLSEVPVVRVRVRPWTSLNTFRGVSFLQLDDFR